MAGIGMAGKVMFQQNIFLRFSGEEEEEDLAFLDQVHS
jgi:hypothetical protein